MRDWVPFHIELCSGGKRGLPRAVRFVFMELSLKVKKGRGSIKLPIGMSDLDALHDLVGGTRREVSDALRLLTAPLPGEDDAQPMIVLDGPELARTLRIPSWAKWAAAKELPGASTERWTRHRDAREGTQAITDSYQHDQRSTNEAPTVDQRSANGRPTKRQRSTGQDSTETDQIQPETLEVLPDTSEPTGVVDPEAAAGAEEQAPEDSPGMPGDADGHQEPVDVAWLASRLTAPLFQPLLADADLVAEMGARIAMSGARRDDVAKAIDDYPLNARRGRRDPSEIVGGLLSFVGGAIAARRKVEAKPLRPAERETMDLWLRLWSREHNGATYPVSPRDHDHIRKLFARAKARAKVLELPNARQVVEHYIAGYLRIDDKKLVTERYPIALLESRLPAIGEYQTTKPTPVPLQVDATPPPPMAEMPADFFQKLNDVGQSGPIPRRSVH